MLVEAYEVN